MCLSNRGGDCGNVEKEDVDIDFFYLFYQRIRLNPGKGSKKIIFLGHFLPFFGAYGSDAEMGLSQKSITKLSLSKSGY